MVAIFDIGYLLASELKKAQKRATLADRPYVESVCACAVSARAPPCRGDRLIVDRQRTGKRLARAHAGILPGEAVGRGNVDKCGHVIVPRRVQKR